MHSLIIQFASLVVINSLFLKYTSFQNKYKLIQTIIIFSGFTFYGLNQFFNKFDVTITGYLILLNIVLSMFMIEIYIKLNTKTN